MLLVVALGVHITEGVALPHMAMQCNVSRVNN